MSELFVHHLHPTHDYFLNINRSIKYLVKLQLTKKTSHCLAPLQFFKTTYNNFIIEFPQRERISYFRMRTLFLIIKRCRQVNVHYTYIYLFVIQISNLFRFFFYVLVSNYLCYGLATNHTIIFFVTTSYIYLYVNITVIFQSFIYFFNSSK